MNEHQNNFYTSVSRYYSEIFPFNKTQLEFIENECGTLKNKSILDIGCATGELAYRLSEKEAHVTGIDLNEDLLEQAAKTKKGPHLQFQKGNMLDLESDFDASAFDTVLCFGNTIVHLSSQQEVLKMFQGVRSTLKKGGAFLLQLLNYDYILAENVKELPLIETENIRFERRYSWKENPEIISFETRLFLKNEGELIRNKINLLPLKSDELKALLLQAGFSEINFFSNFQSGRFGGTHIPLVVSCRK